MHTPVVAQSHLWSAPVSSAKARHYFAAAWLSLAQLTRMSSRVSPNAGKAKPVLRAICCSQTRDPPARILMVAPPMNVRPSYVMNLRDHGRLHIVSAKSLKLPRNKHRTCCGWRFGQVGAYTTRQMYNILRTTRHCKRCFLRAADGPDACPQGEYDSDIIEQYE